MRALVVLCVAGAGALNSYDAAALRRALGAAKPYAKRRRYLQA